MTERYIPLGLVFRGDYLGVFRLWKRVGSESLFRRGEDLLLRSIRPRLLPQPPVLLGVVQVSSPFTLLQLGRGRAGAGGQDDVANDMSPIYTPLSACRSVLPAA